MSTAAQNDRSYIKIRKFAYYYCYIWSDVSQNDKVRLYQPFLLHVLGFIVKKIITQWYSTMLNLLC